jgi:beta-mannosidase
MWNCTVRLNGVNLGSHVGQFEPFEFDISALLRAPGVRNTLTVTTIPFVDGNVTRFKQEIFNSPTYTHQVSCWLNVHAPQWMGRTIYGWDFVPALYSAGIWRDVLLHPTGIAPLPSNGGGVSVVAATAAATVAPLSKSPVAATVTLRAKSLGVIPRPEPPYRRVPLQLTLEVELIELAPSVSNGTVSFQCEWTIASPDGVQVARLSVPYTVHVATGSTTQTLRANATLISPRLWWPNGYGSQPIYTARATMIATVGRRLLDSATATFGVRELKVSTNPHLRQGWSYTQYGPEHTWSPPWGWGDWQASTKPPIPPNATAWQVAINGRKVFLRGGNWIPRDQLFGRGVRQTNRTTAILQAAAFAGFTWMRIWGGGLIEDQHFYDECDRLGLMLLQEFPHAGCSPGGPGDSTPDYSWRMPLDKLQTQMALKQLVNHPSAPCTP